MFLRYFSKNFKFGLKIFSVNPIIEMIYFADLRVHYNFYLFYELILKY